MLKITALLTLLVPALAASGQKLVAITIDDVPGLSAPRKAESTRLLSRLDSASVPVAVFINESHLENNNNGNILAEWAKRDFVTLGNHTYSHPHYTEVGFDRFVKEISKGETITLQLAALNDKGLSYFRFPYNDLGSDSTGQKVIADHLAQKGYEVAPFTVESADWMFNVVYNHYLTKNDSAMARSIGNTYVEHTLALFEFFENMAGELFRRPIPHIYLCHDNALNADYLPVLMERLSARGYRFISLSEAMTDEAYKTQNHYYGNAGFSWLYRWIPDTENRKNLLRSEPENPEVYQEYLKLTGQK